MQKVVNQTDKKTHEISLIQLLDRVQRWLETQIVHEVADSGGVEIQTSDIKLLANLDCGTTYASEVARRMGISRQSVTQLLQNLVRQGLITLEIDPKRRNTKLIVMTEAGKEWVRKAVAACDRLEEDLALKIGRDHAVALRRALEAFQPSE